MMKPTNESISKYAYSHYNITIHDYSRSRLKFAAYAMLLHVLPCIKVMIEDPHGTVDEFAAFLILVRHPFHSFVPADIISCY